MTIQFPDRLSHNGQILPLWSEPLSSFLSRRRPQPKFEFMCSANWRRYVACWEIRDGNLLLLSISGRLRNCSDSAAVALFPGRPLPISADWYTGKLCVPCGKPIAGKRWIYGPAYDDHIQIEVVRGAVVCIEEGLGPSPAFISGPLVSGLLSLQKPSSGSSVTRP
jgi:hypothetical protein